MENSKDRRRKRQRQFQKENRQAAAIARQAEQRADALNDERRKAIKDPTADIAISRVMSNR